MGDQCQCANCDWNGPVADVGEIKHIFERVMPGEIMPAGECPKCGAVAHLVRPAPQVIVVISEGLVSDIFGFGVPDGMQVFVADSDTDGADEEELVDITLDGAVLEVFDGARYQRGFTALSAPYVPPEEPTAAADPAQPQYLAAARFADADGEPTGWSDSFAADSLADAQEEAHRRLARAHPGASKIDMTVRAPAEGSAQ